MLCAGVAAAQSAPVTATDCLPQWQQGWVRLPPTPAMGMAAGFGQFVNPCDRPLAVVSASSPAFGDVTLHESIQVDGVNRMREVERLPLPAGGKAILSPGGLHLMLMDPAQPLQEGANVPLTFVLADGRRVEAVLQVRKAAP
ncbi:MAG TPA: copper chaperone PCu(A)C [Stenotrophomonas sp.]